MIRFEASLPTLLLVAASSLVNKTDRNKFYARDNNKKMDKTCLGYDSFFICFFYLHCSTMGGGRVLAIALWAKF